MKFRYKILISLFLLILAYLTLVGKLFAPAHRTIALALYLLCWLPVLQAVWIKIREKVHKDRTWLQKIKSWLPYLIVAKLLLTIAHYSYVLVPIEKTALLQWSDQALQEQIQQDLAALKHAKEQSQIILTGMTDILYSDLPLPYAPATRQALFDYWSDYQHLLTECEDIELKYKGFHQIDFNERPGGHANAFCAGFTAFVAQYKMVQALMSRDIFHEKFLPLLPDSVTQEFFSAKQNLTHPNVLIQLSAGYTYIPIVEGVATIDSTVITSLQSDILNIYKQLGRNPEIFVQNPLDYFEQAADFTWFPVQKNITRLMQAIKSSHRPALIGESELKLLKTICQPGDVLLTRNNWELRNLGVPGFWTHAIMAAGSTEHLNQILKSDNNEFETKYASDACLILGSNTQGVQLHPLDSLKTDFIAVLRPNISKSQRHSVLQTALTFLNRPYDFQFDFSTDEALTSTEMIWKAFHYTETLEIPITNINHRMALTPNRIAEFYTNTADTQNPPFELILYLEGDEESLTVTKQNADIFKQTCLRPKLWHVLKN